MQTESRPGVSTQHGHQNGNVWFSSSLTQWVFKKTRRAYSQSKKSVVTSHTKSWKIKNFNQWLGLVSRVITDVHIENWTWVLIPLGTGHIILNVKSLPREAGLKGEGGHCGDNEEKNIQYCLPASQTQLCAPKTNGGICTLPWNVTSYRELSHVI